MTPQQRAIATKIKKGQVKNVYAAKGKIKKISRTKAWNEYLAK